MSAERLYWREVVRRVGTPTEEQIRAEHAANPRLRDESLESVRNGLIGTLEAVGFKHGRWLDTVLMQRPLGPGATADPA